MAINTNSFVIFGCTRYTGLRLYQDRYWQGKTIVLKMYDQEKVDEFINHAENIAHTFDKATALSMIKEKIESCEERYLNEFISALNFVRDESNLDWIEQNTHRIHNVSLSWGHLAAVSYFNWNRAEKWLLKGRPLSLVAIDALVFCTTNGERLNQSLMMRELNPRLADNPNSAVVATSLQKYLLSDNVPRTKMWVNRIINNLFETDQ